MAPLDPRQLAQRSLSSGATFTVVFVAVAGAVVIGGILWACIPRLRGKYLLPLAPSRTKYNQGTLDGGLSGATLTSNPRFSQQLHGALYDVIAAQDLPAPTYHPPTTNLSDASLTSNLSSHRPARRYNSLDRDHESIKGSNTTDNITYPQRAFARDAQTPLQSKDFGDAKEFILAIPEPLSVRSQDRQPRLISSDVPSSATDGKLSSSATSDKLLHPNKLFEQIEAQSKNDNTESGIAFNTQNTSKITPSQDGDLYHQSLRPHQSVLSIGIDMFQSRSDHDGKAPSACDSLSDDDETSPHNASIAAMHRLKTYRSLVGAPLPKPLARAGTLTRPKTPVAEIRNLYDRGAGDSRSAAAVSRNNTVSTKVGTTAGSSDERSSVSSRTSPPKTAPSKFAMSSVSLLPTPLRIMRSPGSRSVTSPTPTPSQSRSIPEHTLKPVSSSRETYCQTTQHQGSIKMYTEPSLRTNRPRPAPLKIRADVHKANLPSINVNRTPICVGGANPGLKRPEIASVQASSIYSRDTRGQSIARTPATQSRQNSSVNRMPCLQVTYNKAEATPSSSDSTEASVAEVKDRAFEASKLIIDNWKAHMNDIHFNTSPSPSLKRALSNLGVGCKPKHMILPAGDTSTRDSVISTEFAPSELDLPDSTTSALHISASSQISGAAMIQGLPRLRASMSDTFLAVVTKGPAPGDANWI